MTAPAIIAGSLVDVRNVNQHKCVRLIIDVPAEHALKVIEAFAWPTMVNPVAVAVARLEQPKGGEAHSSDRKEIGPCSNNIPPVPPADKAPGRAPKAWDEKLLSNQAGMLCHKPLFWQYLNERYGQTVQDSDAAAELVKWACGGIRSRSELRSNSAAGRLWKDIEAQYRAWQREAEVVPA